MACSNVGCWRLIYRRIWCGCCLFRVGVQTCSVCVHCVRNYTNGVQVLFLFFLRFAHMFRKAIAYIGMRTTTMQTAIQTNRKSSIRFIVFKWKNGLSRSIVGFGFDSFFGFVKGFTFWLGPISQFIANPLDRWFRAKFIIWFVEHSFWLRSMWQWWWWWWWWRWRRQQRRSRVVQWWFNDWIPNETIEFFSIYSRIYMQWFICGKKLKPIHKRTWIWIWIWHDFQFVVDLRIDYFVILSKFPTKEMLSASGTV